MAIRGQYKKKGKRRQELDAQFVIDGLIKDNDDFSYSFPFKLNALGIDEDKKGKKNYLIQYSQLFNIQILFILNTNTKT